MEFKGKFRLTYDLFKEFNSQLYNKSKIIEIAAIIFFMILMLFVSIKYFIIYIFVILFVFIVNKQIVKKTYYENQKGFMRESLITVNFEGITDEDANSRIFYPISDVIKAIETKESFFLYVAPKKAICMSKNQFIDNNHIRQLRCVLNNYYRGTRLSLMTEDYTGIFYGRADDAKPVFTADGITENMPGSIPPYTIAENSQKKSHNRLAIISIYAFICIAVIAACVMPDLLKGRDKDNSTVFDEDGYDDSFYNNHNDNAPRTDTLAESIQAYIDEANYIIELQEKYKASEEYLSEIDTAYDDLSDCYYNIDFYDDNRDASLVLLYKLDSVCYELLYIMDKPYSQLNYIEMDEYNKTLNEIQTYIDKLNNISVVGNGQI